MEENWIQVFDPNGVRVGNATGEFEASVDLSIQTAGTYLILLADVNGDETRAYSVTLQLLEEAPLGK